MNKQDSKPDFSYEAFVQQPAVQPPASFTDQLRTLIHRKLNPPKHVVFLILGVTHVLIATGVLLLCPHMGVVLIPGFPGVTSWFRVLGHFPCLVMCGFVMMAPTFLYASLFFKSEILKVLCRSKWFLLFPIIVLTLGCLLGLGGGPSQGMDICAWLLGAGIGSFLVFEMGIRLNRKFLRE